MPKKIDLLGQRFGMMVVISKAPDHISPSGTRHSKWLCRCDCGNTAEIFTSMRHVTASCGCRKIEQMRQHGLAKRTHGMAGTPEHKAWKHIKDRCHNKNNKRYPEWGGRGITVCEHWRDSFESFFADMGPRPGPGYSIDRIDNFGNYEPGNCRWATRSTQSKNSRKGRLITHNGRTQNLCEWAAEVGLKAITIHRRLRAGWTVEEALTVPLQKSRHWRHTTDGL